jgi:4-amino-4-deoxy-L-arabinose transferase-like glycosyltransferase
VVWALAAVGRRAAAPATFSISGVEHSDLGPKMSQGIAMERRNSLYKGVLLFIFSLIYFIPFVRVLWRIIDEGTLVYGAHLVAQRALPYRDFFEVMGPGSFYWLGLFFKLFGTNVMVARAVLLFTASLTVVLLYWMTRRVYQGPFDLLPSLFYLLVAFPVQPVTSHHWDSNLFGLLTVGAFFLWQDRGRWWLLAIAGVLAGLTSCFLQPKGLFLVVALALVILVNDCRAGESKLRIASHLGILLGGFAAVGGLLLLFFFFAGGLSDLIYANLIWPLRRYHNINKLPYGYGLREWVAPYCLNRLQTFLPASLSRVMVIFTMIPFLFIVYLPFLLVGLTGISCLSKSNRSKIFNASLLPYWAAGLALWVSELHRQDVIHLVYGSPLLLILSLVIWNYCWNRLTLLKYLGIGLITACVILLGSFNVLIASNTKHKIITRQGVLYGFKEDPALKFLIEHTKPGDYAFIYPYYPMYYFLADVKNPTRYSILVYHINTNTQFNEVIKNLEQKSVKYVLWDTMVAGSNLKILFPQYKQPSNDNLHLERYLEDHYEAIGIQNGFKILRRRQ